MSNLEPIEESDLNLEKKFGGNVENKSENKTEAPKVAEKKEEEVSQEVSSAEKDSSYNKILSKIQSAPANDGSANVKDDSESVYAKTDAESQIQHLVDIALTKGVVHSVKVARHLEDNYVLDMFHDKLLADELHDALVKKGLIKEL